MALNWINAEEFSLNSLLLLERFQIRLLCGQTSPAQRRNLGIALRHNPCVAWYLARRCPERAAYIAQVIECAPKNLGANEVRGCEVQVIRSIEDFITYTQPEQMDARCNFIYGWDQARLFELADFADKIVLDVGAGSGRLAFAAAQAAREVYASEPVGTLREYLRDKIRREGIANVRVVDGMAHSLAYPNDTFDIVMSGHVVGDDLAAEVAELTRVVKDGGLLIDCPGEDDRDHAPDARLVADGWQPLPYVGRFGATIYRYRKQIVK